MHAWFVPQSRLDAQAPSPEGVGHAALSATGSKHLPVVKQQSLPASHVTPAHMTGCRVTQTSVWNGPSIISQRCGPEPPPPAPPVPPCLHAGSLAGQTGERHAWTIRTAANAMSRRMGVDSRTRRVWAESTDCGLSEVTRADPSRIFPFWPTLGSSPEHGPVCVRTFDARGV